jgi:hypothetical protein
MVPNTFGCLFQICWKTSFFCIILYFRDWYMYWKFTCLDIAGGPMYWIGLEYYLWHSCRQVSPIQTCEKRWITHLQSLCVALLSIIILVFSNLHWYFVMLQVQSRILFFCFQLATMLKLVYYIDLIAFLCFIMCRVCSDNTSFWGSARDTFLEVYHHPHLK